MAKRNYLVEGLSGVGKSSVYEELIRRGYKAISTDRAWKFHADPDTGLSGGPGHFDDALWDQQKAVRELESALFEEEAGNLKDRKDLPVLIVHGTFDDVIPVNAARRTRHVLEENGITPEYLEFPMGHFVTQESIAVVADFIRRCME